VVGFAPEHWYGGTVRGREDFVGAVVAASATRQASSGLDVLLLGAERLLRRNLRFVTCGFTVLCGTGHVICTMLPIIYAPDKTSISCQ
jgi:anaerobic C4-dicarboxylate transporter